jgi:dephospho-CoA kinase
VLFSFCEEEDKMIIGLTGGIASGKSTIAKMFQTLNVDVIDADKIAKDIYNTDEIQREILKNFKTTDRKKIKEIIFRDKSQLKIINGIIHPKVREYYEKVRKNTPDELIKIFDIPLLFETKMEDLCDIIVVVDINRENQIKRIVQRDTISIELAEKIIDSQMSSEEKVKRATFVIDNNGSKEELEKNFKNVVKQIGKVKK